MVTAWDVPRDPQKDSVLEGSPRGELVRWGYTFEPEGPGTKVTERTLPAKADLQKYVELQPAADQRHHLDPVDVLDPIRPPAGRYDPVSRFFFSRQETAVCHGS